MTKQLRIVIAGFLAGIFLAGCTVPVSPPQPDAPPIGGDNPPVVNGGGSPTAGGGGIDMTDKMVAFYYAHSGMSIQQCYTYEVQAAPEGASVRVELEAGHFVMEETVPEDVMAALAAIALDNNLADWNGFDGSDDQALDGSGFSIEMKFDSGASVSASGNNVFPPGYFDAAEQIDALFERLVEKYGNRYPKEIVSDDISDFLFYITGGPAYRQEFYCSVSKRSDNRLLINTRSIKRTDLFPEEEYGFYGYTDHFPFEAVQNVVRKYDMPAWNGPERIAADHTGKEYYQIQIRYSSGEELQALGSVYPENYEAARDELLSILVPFILENRDRFIPWGG